jgi:hypothetical protein
MSPEPLQDPNIEVQPIDDVGISLPSQKFIIDKCYIQNF